MVQKILWPEILGIQGRVHATEKLENDENDGKQIDFWARLALEIDQGSSLRESLKDTWLVETVETDNKAAVWSNFLFTGGKLTEVWESEKSTAEVGFLKISEDPPVGFWYRCIKT